MNMAFTLRMSSSAPGLELTILADYLPEPQPELPEFSVVRCWGFNRSQQSSLSLACDPTPEAGHRLVQHRVCELWGKPLPAFFGLTSRP